jgi:hypothetical protein
MDWDEVQLQLHVCVTERSLTIYGVGVPNKSEPH